jgi:hypothetical protein
MAKPMDILKILDFLKMSLSQNQYNAEMGVVMLVAIMG